MVQQDGDRLIEAKGVSLAFRRPRRIREILLKPFGSSHPVDVLQDVNLAIQPGERIAFLGPNGAGKSTLLRVLGGLLIPSSGEVRIGGLETRRFNCEARRRVGFVLNEDRSFYWRLTGEENLEFFGALDDIHGRKLRRNVSELMDAVGLAGASGKRVSDYSSGMRQRLAIARGLLPDPDILIMDEPTRTLDPLGAAEVREVVRETSTAKKRRTVLIATHQFEEVESLCDRVCVVSGGRVSPCEEVRLFDAGRTMLSFYLARVSAQSGSPAYAD